MIAAGRALGAVFSAQRRPVLSDRQLGAGRPARPGDCSSLNEGRSCRTGNSCTSGPRRPPRPALNEGRSCRTGNSRHASTNGPAGRSSLNEGRSCRTGNSRRGVFFDHVVLLIAQRRPVLSDRQLLQSRSVDEMVVFRSTKAGPVGPATPDARSRKIGGPNGRSTKAGPVGPATQPAASALQRLL